MARKANLTRTELLDRLSEAFLQYGYEGASLSRLSDATGLAKATLYHHFPNGKADMAAAVLARAGQRLQDLVLTPLTDRGRNPKDRLLASVDGTLEFYGGDHPACTMNAMLMGEGAGLFGATVQQGLGAWRRLLADALAESGAGGDAAAVIDRLQGALIRSRAEGSRQALLDTAAALKVDFGA